MSIQVSNLVHPFIRISTIYPLELTSHENKKIIVTGNNGSGKTTFLKILLKDLKPKRGSIAINGEIAYLGTKNGLKSQIKIRNQLPYFLDNQKTFPWPQFLDLDYQELSLGQQRLVSLWLILQTTKPILLLDEPFMHLDANSIALACTWLDLQKTIIFTHHHVDELNKMTCLQVLDLNL